MNYKILMYTTASLIVANLLIGLFTNFWGDSNYPDYINSILGLILIISATQVFSKRNKNPLRKQQLSEGYKASLPLDLYLFNNVNI